MCRRGFFRASEMKSGTNFIKFLHQKLSKTKAYHGFLASKRASELASYVDSPFANYLEPPKWMAEYVAS